MNASVSIAGKTTSFDIMAIAFPYLDKPALEQLGISGWSFGMRDRVRFSELDPLNHVNNAAYFSWFETVRIGYIMHFGISGMTHTDADPQLVVRRQTADYLAPILFRDLYTVTIRTAQIKPSSLIMEFAIYMDGKVVAAGETVMVSLTQDGSARETWRAEAIANIVEADGAKLIGFDPA